MERKLYGLRSPFEIAARNEKPGRIIGPFSSLMDDAACRSEALTAVGRQLRKRYDPQVSDPMPEGLQRQLQRLAAAERAHAHGRNRSDG